MEIKDKISKTPKSCPRYTPEIHQGSPQLTYTATVTEEGIPKGHTRFIQSFRIFIPEILQIHPEIQLRDIRVPVNIPCLKPYKWEEFTRCYSKVTIVLSP